jgi:hypothetical protein
MRLTTPRFFLALLISLFCLSDLAAQKMIKDEPTKVDILVFENLERQQLRFIRHGGGLQYALRSNPKQKFSGLLEYIGEDSITVSGQNLALRDLAYIKGKVRSERDITGGVLVGIGLTTTALGTAFISSYVGIGIVAGGITALAVGINFITAKRKFDFNKGWEAYGGTIQYTR